MKFSRIALACVVLFSLSGHLWAQKPVGDFGHGVAAKEAPDGVLDINYQLNSFAFDLRDISASGTPVVLSDDAVSGAVPIGFAFEFYGTEYTQVYISSNGFVTFNAGSPNGCCSGQILPNPSTPNNLVALFWEDLDPPEGGTIRYQTLGAAPNREFVVGYYNIQHFPSGNAVSMEMILREGSNIVELQYLTAPTDGGTHSTGVESDGGLRATQVDVGGGYSYSNEGFVLLPLVGVGEVVDANYQASPTAYNLRDISASGTSVALGDDDVSDALPIGFTLEYYGLEFTEAYISSNGFVTFRDGGGTGCCSGEPIPDPGLPNNLVALYWEDLDPPEGGTIRYQTLGAAPSREFVVGYYNIQHYPSGNAVTMEMILHEGSNNVELQYGFAPSDGDDHSTGVESGGGLFGTQVDFGDYTYEGEGFLLTPEGIVAPSPIARFPVEKIFDDGNPAEVEVTISCNTGLPLTQTISVAQGDGGVTFVVTDFEEGTLDCEIAETSGEDGYDQEYFFGAESSDESCTYEGVEFETVNVCVINNTLLAVDVDVTKEWIDENPQFEAINYAEASYGCSGAQFGNNPYGQLEFFGNPGADSFEVFPHWNGNTNCWVTEQFVETGVESDDSDCSSLSVTPGNGTSCTIVNTRLYEGIPTLSQYGLALLAMLMLGIGLVAFRRFA